MLDAGSRLQDSGPTNQIPDSCFRAFKFAIRNPKLEIMTLGLQPFALYLKWI